jgi:outer membrane immunogenic protein
MNVLRSCVAGLGLAASVVVLCQPATADGYCRRGPGVAGCCFSWTGFYIGANAGIASDDLSSSLAVTNATPGYFAAAAIPGVNESGSQNLDSHGFTGGVQAGYNVQSGALVWGIEIISTRFG